MSGACETLELAKSQLFVAGQQVSSMPSSSSAHSVLVRTAKDLLQAVLRVSKHFFFSFTHVTQASKYF